MWKTNRFRYVIRELKLGDKVLILCLLLLAGVSGFLLRSTRGGAKYCIISVDGKDVYKLSLSEPQIVRVKGVIGESIIEIRGGAVRMIDSPCDLKICVKQGKIHSPGESIICIPNRVMVRVTGKEKVDAITY